MHTLAWSRWNTQASSASPLACFSFIGNLGHVRRVMHFKLYRNVYRAWMGVCVRARNKHIKASRGRFYRRDAELRCLLKSVSAIAISVWCSDPPFGNGVINNLKLLSSSSFGFPLQHIMKVGAAGAVSMYCYSWTVRAAAKHVLRLPRQWIHESSGPPDL